MNKLVDVASMLAVVAGIMVLVRPGSQGPQLAKNIGDSWVGALVTATGSGIPTGYTPTSWS